MNKFRFWLIPILMGILLAGNSYAAIGDIDAKTGQGTYNAIDVYRLTSTPTILLSTSSVSAGITLDPANGITIEGAKSLTLGALSSINFGSTSVSISTTATSGTSQGNKFTAFLAAGSGFNAAVEGSLLCATTTATNNFVSVCVCPATNVVTNWVGIAVTAASTGAIVNVYNEGWILARTTGTVNVGDVLVSTISAAGSLAAQNAPTTGADVGVALGNGTSSGGLTRIRLR